MPTAPEIAEAHAASSAIVRRTPMLTAASLSAELGGTLVLKAENLQRTGSFKLRGALNKLRHVPPGTTTVVAGSAGNHAQALAYAARAAGLGCKVFMPVGAAVSKVAAVAAFGAAVSHHGTSVDECVAVAREAAAEDGCAFVHPFDDLAIVTGQAGLGLELVEDVRDLAAVVVPVGGGGLASGVAMAVKQRRPDVRVVGVQARACAPFGLSLSGGAPVTADAAPTLADGIAIKRPGDLTFRLIQRWLDDMVTVDETVIAQAMMLLAERAKLVAEGAGAAALGAVVSGAVTPSAQGVTAIVVSGGNVDAGVLAGVAARSETRAGRRLRLVTRVADRPWGLANLLAAVAAANGNVLQLEHVRDGIPLDAGEVAVELTVETRGARHARALLDVLVAEGYAMVDGVSPESTVA